MNGGGGEEWWEKVEDGGEWKQERDGDEPGKDGTMRRDPRQRLFESYLIDQIGHSDFELSSSKMARGQELLGSFCTHRNTLFSR